jgi:hypothetical protein
VRSSPEFNSRLSALFSSESTTLKSREISQLLITLLSSLVQWILLQSSFVSPESLRMKSLNGLVLPRSLLRLKIFQNFSLSLCTKIKILFNHMNSISTFYSRIRNELILQPNRRSCGECFKAIKGQNKW